MRVGRRGVAIGIAVALAVAGSAARVRASPFFDASTVSAKTVGWATYRQLDRLPQSTDGVTAAQFASTDPSERNRDYWDGPQHCLSLVIGQCVLAVHTGAGEIDGIWFTWNGGDVRSVGNISIVLDGLPL